MSDPTAIEISFDPTVQRMKGVTVHGGLSFDVPFISEIDRNLWQGGCEEGLVLPKFIRHLVSLYPWERFTVKRNLDSTLIVRMYDSEDQTFEQVEELGSLGERLPRNGPGARALPGWPEQVEPRGCPSAHVGR